MKCTVARALFVVLTIATTSCAEPTDTPERRADAEAIAHDFLTALTGAADDRGWSMLHSASRDGWSAEEEYVAAVERADWTSFQFRVIETLFCDDGVMCSVTVKVAGGVGAVPDFLRLPGKSSAAGLRFEDPGQPDHATLWVWLPDVFRGPGGVMLTAG